MQFVYHVSSGDSTLQVEGELHKYLFKVRRMTNGSLLNFRNLKDDILYKYSIDFIDKKRASLTLVDSKKYPVLPSLDLHVGWCIVDTKSIEKILPHLNEIGISQITFIQSDFSQKNYKPNLERLEKILINSSGQCGRSNLLKIDFCQNIETFLDKYPDTFILDFSENRLENSTKVETILVGPEGGFSDRERELFVKTKVFGFDSKLILKSETAVMATASKILL
jgi:16S rRNA (uracil1498-N3)-methyltransferase